MTKLFFALTFLAVAALVCCALFTSAHASGALASICRSDGGVPVYTAEGRIACVSSSAVFWERR